MDPDDGHRCCPNLPMRVSTNQNGIESGKETVTKLPVRGINIIFVVEARLKEPVLIFQRYI